MTARTSFSWFCCVVTCKIVLASIQRVGSEIGNGNLITSLQVFIRNSMKLINFANELSIYL